MNRPPERVDASAVASVEVLVLEKWGVGAPPARLPSSGMVSPCRGHTMLNLRSAENMLFTRYAAHDASSHMCILSEDLWSSVYGRHPA